MKIDFDALKIAARGKWVDIIQSMGIDIRTDNIHCPCPVCGGTDRARFDNKDGDGTYICGQHGAGDGFDLVQKSLGLSFPETIKAVQEVVGGCLSDTSQNVETYDPKPPLTHLWQSSVPLTGGDVVSKYLHKRGLLLQPDNIRFCESCWESSTKKRIPAMIARIMDPAGKPIGLHRTYLEGEQKAKIDSPRKLMKPVTSLSGGAIRLFKPQNNTLGIAEGIETAIAARQITQIPTWAAVSSTLLKAFQPPDDIKRLVIFADADANFCGQQAAYTLANRLVQTDRIIEVELPEMGKDFNDCLMELRERGDG